MVPSAFPLSLEAAAVSSVAIARYPNVDSPAPQYPTAPMDDQIPGWALSDIADEVILLPTVSSDDIVNRLRFDRGTII